MSRLLKCTIFVLFGAAASGCGTSNDESSNVDVGVATDTGPAPADSQAPESDSSPDSDAEPQPLDGGGPQPDAQAPTTDAGSPMDASSVSDAMASMDAAAPAADAGPPAADAGPPAPDADVPAEEPEYDGLGLVPVESNLYLRPAHLEQTAADEFYLSFLVRRLLPRVDGVGDTSHLQPWLMYRPGEGPDWLWILMGFYLPYDAVNRLPDGNQRVEAGRTGPWHRMVNDQRAALPAGTTAAEVVAQPGIAPVCGRAMLSARFEVRLPDGNIIQDVVGVMMTISRNDELDLSWLDGCGRNAVP